MSTIHIHRTTTSTPASENRVCVPVQGQCVDRLLSAGHAIGGGELIVEIDGAGASGNLPCAPATAGQRERVVRHNATW